MPPPAPRHAHPVAPRHRRPNYTRWSIHCDGSADPWCQAKIAAQAKAKHKVLARKHHVDKAKTGDATVYERIKLAYAVFTNTDHMPNMVSYLCVKAGAQMHRGGSDEDVDGTKKLETKKGSSYDSVGTLSGENGGVQAEYIILENGGYYLAHHFVMKVEGIDATQNRMHQCESRSSTCTLLARSVPAARVDYNATSVRRPGLLENCCR